MEKLTLKQIAEFCGVPEGFGFEEAKISGVSTDSRTIRRGELYIPIKGERFDGHDFIPEATKRGAAAVVSSREVDAPVPVINVPSTLGALHTIAAGYRGMSSARVCAVTGSVGKTTTKELCACVLSQAFITLKNEGNLNNLIGLPLSVLRLDKTHEAAVFEMGMNHFGEMSTLSRIAAPTASVITNIGVAHIENLGSREGILNAKLEVLEGMARGGTLILNGDEALLWNLKDRLDYDIIYFGVENPLCDLRAVDITISKTSVSFTIQSLNGRFEVSVAAPGIHNVYNGLAAAAVGQRFGVSNAEISRGLSVFRTSGMRQNIYEKSGFTIIEDCYNANPESMGAALGMLSNVGGEGRRIAVLGGMLELGDLSAEAHRELGKTASKMADMIFLYGEGMEHCVAGALEEGMPPSKLRLFYSHNELARELGLAACEGDALLFKGSRGMRMEEVLKLFLEAVG